MLALSCGCEPEDVAEVLPVYDYGVVTGHWVGHTGDGTEFTMDLVAGNGISGSMTRDGRIGDLQGSTDADEGLDLSIFFIVTWPNGQQTTGSADVSDSCDHMRSGTLTESSGATDTFIADKQ